MNDDRLWQELNAYADGELQGEPRARLEAALAADPALHDKLKRIATVKRALAADRPAPEAEASTTGWKLPAAAVAACVVAALLGIGAFLPLAPAPSWQERLVAAHTALSERTFVVEQNRALPVVSSRRLDDFAVPDLRASRLYLVEARTRQKDGIERLVMHYRGMRGCALTIAAMAPVIGEAGIAGWDPESGTLFVGWQVDRLAFAVIADGMDEARFQAIADYVKAAIDDRLTPRNTLQTAMAESYRAAKPCASGVTNRTG